MDYGANKIKLFICSYFRYPEARAIQRKIIFHSGPTNSGKTYHAIKRYLSAASGVYCGPLKLLAHEIFEKSNAAVSTTGYSFISPVTSLSWGEGTHSVGKECTVPHYWQKCLFLCTREPAGVRERWWGTQLWEEEM